MRTYTFTSLLLLGLIAVTLAADCNNPLLATYGLDKDKLATAATLTGAKFCKSLQGKPSCCTATTVNTFQTKVKDLTDKLGAAIGKRDKAIVDARDKTIPDLQTKLKAVKDQSQKASTAILAKTADQKTADKSKVKDDKANTVLLAVKAVTTQVTDSLSSLKSSFTDFQKSRTSCVTQLIKLQAAAWCLACDPDYGTKGVTGATAITLSTKVCSRLQSSCYKFLQGSASQSNILSGASLSTVLDDLTASMTKITNNDNSGKDDFKTAMDKVTKNSAATTDKKAAVTPDTCTSDTKCDWICTNLFKSAQIDQDVTTVGGAASTALDSPPADAVAARLLQSESVDESETVGVVQDKLSSMKRVLQANEFDPAEDEAGVDATFQDDPAGVNPTTTTPAPSSGLSLERSMFGMIVVMVSAFFM